MDLLNEYSANGIAIYSGKLLTEEDGVNIRSLMLLACGFVLGKMTLIIVICKQWGIFLVWLTRNFDLKFKAKQIINFNHTFYQVYKKSYDYLNQSRAYLIPTNSCLTVLRIAEWNLQVENKVEKFLLRTSNFLLNVSHK